MRNRRGHGSAWYVSAALDDNSLRAVLRQVLTTAGLPARPSANRDVEIVTRTDGSTDYTFILNHGTTGASVTVPARAWNLLTDTEATGAIDLPGLGAAVLSHPTSPASDLLTVTIPSRNIEV